MVTPNQVISPQLAALQSQFEQLQSIYNEINQKNVSGMPSIAGASITAPASIPFVNGLAGARDYLKNMAPNSSAAVFDHDDAVFYTLSVDANGVAAPIKVCRFTVEEASEPPVEAPLTKKDLEDFKAEIMSMLTNKEE